MNENVQKIEAEMGKEGTVVVKRVREEKAKDVIELLKMLETFK